MPLLYDVVIKVFLTKQINLKIFLKLTRNFMSLLENILKNVKISFESLRWNI